VPVAERYTTTSREFLEAAQLAVASGWAIIQSARRLLGEVQARLRVTVERLPVTHCDTMATSWYRGPRRDQPAPQG